MPQVSVSDADKERFDELKDSEQTHKEFFSEILRTYENAEETVTIDTQAIVDKVAHKVAAEVEMSAYRGVTEALEQANE